MRSAFHAALPRNHLRSGCPSCCLATALPSSFSPLPLSSLPNNDPRPLHPVHTSTPTPAMMLTTVTSTRIFTGALRNVLAHHLSVRQASPRRVFPASSLPPILGQRFRESSYSVSGAFLNPWDLSGCWRRGLLENGLRRAGWGYAVGSCRAVWSGRVSKCFE